MLQSQKQVRIERLAATLPLTILQNSRRRHIERFLSIKALSILVIWFPIIREVISRQIKAGTQLIIALDRTQWKEYNVLMVSAIYPELLNFYTKLYISRYSKTNQVRFSTKHEFLKPMNKTNFLTHTSLKIANLI